MYYSMLTSLFSRFESGTGHYTQMVWAETEYLGCGHITFPSSSGRGRGSFRRIIVCNYGPAGNFVGEPVYIRARPCTMCPFQSSCQVDQGDEDMRGLCINKGERSELKILGLFFVC